MIERVNRVIMVIIQHLPQENNMKKLQYFHYCIVIYTINDRTPSLLEITRDSKVLVITDFESRHLNKDLSFLNDSLHKCYDSKWNVHSSLPVWVRKGEGDLNG